MPNQSARQKARRAALDAQSRMRQARAERERRRSGLAVSVVTALAERDELVGACEARAGEALRGLTEDEGLTLAEAVEWGGEQLDVREATRLRKVVLGAGAERDPSGSPTSTREPAAGDVPAAG
ncbi:hypothetical protein [Phycicoccus flavus]|uniref:hypothetical protein n=1 Tax=Phycicoccus flavus TaxID=2502783 RepID=UPI000FEBA3B2|nr:hypothetical protein [Phycicoccus flavus]NHA69971.1 hypothetical protein [Phycicoccus flavus]